MIDTLLGLALIGILIPIVIKMILKLNENFTTSDSGSLEEIGEIVSLRKEIWMNGDPSPLEEVECQYCGTLFPHDLSKCPNCYAPRRMKT